MTFLLILLASTLRVSLPLIFAALGGMFSERSGVINIALEGMMLIGAFTSAVFALSFHSPWVGALAGGAAGVLTAALYAFFVIKLKANQIVTGVAINMLAMGIPPFFLKVLYGSTASSPSIPLQERFHSAPLWMGALVVLISWFWMQKTTSGLWIQFAGEHPEALEAAGIRVNRWRFFSVLISGLLAGLGGTTLSIYLSSAYSGQMTAGRGFMALAALILGKWQPIPTTLACLLFGFFDAFQIQLQGSLSDQISFIPVQFIQILPYVLTILVLAGVVGRSRAPKSLGIPFGH